MGKFGTIQLFILILNISAIIHQSPHCYVLTTSKIVYFKPRAYGPKSKEVSLNESREKKPRPSNNLSPVYVNPRCKYSGSKNNANPICTYSGSKNNKTLD